MDISQINDIEKLKAMAYDQLLAQQQAARNLQLLEQRIAELQKENAQAGKETKSE